MRLKAADYKYLYSITCDITPLNSDCGLLCGSVCCSPDAKNSLGVHLFPGEECRFDGNEDWLTWDYLDPVKHGFPDSWDETVYFLKCSAPCPRDKRPLACRFFPLAPHILTDGTLLITYETIKLPYSCPLITKKFTLRKDFIETVARAWLIMLRDPRIYDLAREDSREREKEARRIPPVLWSSL